MVSEHRKRKFPEHLLSSTFAICSWGNGLTAILAGFIAQAASDIHGDIGPFKVAIALTAITLVMILPWNENFGSGSGSNNNNEENTDHQHENKSAKIVVIESGLWSSCVLAFQASWNIICTDRCVLFLGLSQAAFEGAVYSFGGFYDCLFVCMCMLSVNV